ncbi:MAG TPA: hypothetical protein DEB37_07585 [Lysinibacillus sp.]|nr:hypothetical protein [Lysinibacillus sp.]
MNLVKNKRTPSLKIDSHAMALAYQEMGDLNLHISMEMDHLEWEAQRIIDSLLEKIDVLDIY